MKSLPLIRTQTYPTSGIINPTSVNPLPPRRSTTSSDGFPAERDDWNWHDDDTRHHHQSSSAGSWIFGRRRHHQHDGSHGGGTSQSSKHVQELVVSRARACELSARLEMSDNRPTDLVKMSLPRPSTHQLDSMSSTKSLIGNPQFAAPMTAKAAKEVFARKENSHPPSSMTLDPLWTERECRNALREMEVQRRKTVLHSTLSPASQLTHGPTGFDYLPLSLNERRSCSNNNNKGDVAPQPLQIDVILAPQLINVPTKKATKNLRRNNSNSKQRLNIRKTNEAMTPLALLSPGSCSVALTEPNTPSPKQGETRIGFAPGQQQRQHLPHVC